MTQKSRQALTLCLGYLDGLRTRRHLDRAAAERALVGLAQADIEAYLNGHDDGVKGERTRYMAAKATLAQSGQRVYE